MFLYASQDIQPPVQVNLTIVFEERETNMAETTAKDQASRRRAKAEEATSTPAVEAPKSGNFITRTWGDFTDYLANVRKELQKVTWPTRKEAIRLTRIVIATLLVAAIVMGAINLFFTAFVRFGISAPIVFVVLFAVIAGVAFYRFRRDGTGRSRLS